MKQLMRIQIWGWLLVLSSALLAADVTMHYDSGGKGLGFEAQGESVTYIQGLKMRNETTLKGDLTITILDLDAQQFITLDPKKKRAEVTNLADMSRQLREISGGDVSVRMDPTGQTRDIGGQTCQDYRMAVRVAASPIPDQPIQVLMQGPVCLAPEAPGKDEVVRFYSTAAERGLFFGNPRVAQGQPGQAKGLAELYRVMSEKGVPYAMDMEISFEGTGMIAQMMARMGKSSMQSTLTRISTESLDPSLFEIPEGYKVKK